MIVLVLGGTRSGKSAVAESITEATARSLHRPVVYVATAVADPTDDDHLARIAAHRARRPGHWQTVECAVSSDLIGHLRTAQGVALVDSIGTWVTHHRDLVVDTTDLLECLRHRPEPTVIVSEEVGLAVHPPSEIGRRYVDTMGSINQQIAGIADRALLVVAGRVVELAAPDPSRIPS